MQGVFSVLQSFMVVAAILDRNQELSFQKPVDMDKVFDVFICQYS